MKNIFVNVKLSGLDLLGFRIGGAGLGNILFPWARGVVFAKKHNIKKINSTWTTFKFGTYFRKEKDKRTYHNIFLENNFKGFVKVFYLLISKKIDEKELENKSLKPKLFPTVINFSGMKNQMMDIRNDYEIVKKELLNIIRNKHVLLSLKNKPQAIAVHIRLGDFDIPNNEKEIRDGKTNCRLPLQWYIQIINNIREKTSKNINVLVFSDGSDEELLDILSLNNVRRARGGTAIADMLSLSYAQLLIASNSTFSLWSSYLGRVSTIWFPGTHRTKLFFKEENLFEGELDYNDAIPDKIISVLK